MILRHGATTYLCCCRHLSSLALRRWWWGTGSRWSDSFCTCDICRKRKKTHLFTPKCPTLGIWLVLSNGLCGYVRCSLWRADPSSVPSQRSELLSGDSPAVNKAFKECKRYRERHRRRLRAATSSGIRFFPWGCDAWECSGKQLSIPLLCTGRSASAAHLPAFISIFLLFKCLLLEFRLTASQAAADVISLKRTNCS